MKIVLERYRDRARLAITALDRYRVSQQSEIPLVETEAKRQEPDTGETLRGNPDVTLQVGGTILYRPAGDRRSYPCRVEKVEGRRAYLVPDIKICTGWVDLERLASEGPSETADP